MFVSDKIVLDLSFGVAQARLASLTHRNWLASASQAAYADGVPSTIRVGPFGDVVGASKLVRVSFLEPVPDDGLAVLPLRWEATGAAGRLFPVLDADLTIREAAAGETLMTLDGAYRPPLGGVGASLDRIVLHRVGTTTIRSLLIRIAGAIANPASATVPTPAAGRQLRPAINRETS